MTGSSKVSSKAPPSFGLLVEQFAPYAGAALVTMIWYVVGRPFPHPIDNLIATSATVASVFAGFLGASAATILTVKDTEVFRRLAAHGYTIDIFNYLRSSLYSSMLFSFLSIIGFFVDPLREAKVIPALGVFAPTYILCATLSLLTFARVSHVLFKLLRQNFS